MPLTVTSRFPELIATIQQNADLAAQHAAEGMVETMKASMKASMRAPSRRDAQGKPVSVPGEAPASSGDGELYESLQSEKIADGHWAAYSDSQIAAYLEYGTKHMAPRPFMTPAADEIAPKFFEELKENVFKL